MPEPTRDEQTSEANLPKGVVLDKDGKPCRTCTSAASWRALSKQAAQSNSNSQDKPQSSTSPASFPLAQSITSAASTSTLPSSSYPASDNQCPPDVEALGHSTWTLLHSLAAAYPTRATPEKQDEMRTFLNVFSKLYPCWVCADDFRNWMAEPSGRNRPRLGGRSEFGWWMCEAHNEVNRKLGKKEFDCRFWEERWRTGWKDGRCD
ncbi:flavin-linked sulfhydryl oxidase [Aspergillus chevalieri]|uniref:Sulfhydryl oxidase n=1 Tax=Aspergillus chevalieri TaxID=182096 RepID=A0A7R7ZMT5_ASPCH|nr:uncharacterized protein ACHE_40407A [Aspergillus chevalieri]BCR87843.1 hypothetical protein ACHE_40407A [Aspergillus chevalieri]